MQPDQSGVFFQLIIVGGGEFTYDASGNLRTANVGQTTTDPLQGITCYAGFSTFNGHGAVISLFSSTLDVQLWYADTSSSTQGALFESAGSTAGTDPFGNGYQSGSVTYSQSGGTFYALQQVARAFTLYSAASAAGPFTTVLSSIALAPSGTITVSTTAAIILNANAGASPVSVTGALDAGDVAVSGSGGALMTVTETAGSPSTPPTQLIAQTAGDRAFGVHVTGDTTQRVAINSIGSVTWSSGSGAVDAQLDRQAANLLEILLADFDIATAGRGFRVKEGANCKQGTATLTAGTVVVANTSVTASSRIFLTAQDNNSTGALRVSARTAGTSFTITSSNAADSGVVAFQIFEPG